MRGIWPIRFVLGTAALLAAVTAAPVAAAQVPDGCPDFHGLPDDALIVPTSYADWPKPPSSHDPFVFTDADETVYSRGIEPMERVDTGGGDDTLFVYDPGNGTGFRAGHGGDTVVFCSMAEYETWVTLGDVSFSPDKQADTVVFEAPVFSGVRPGFVRYIVVDGFVIGTDTLILRVPPSLEVTEQPSPLAGSGTAIAVGDTLIVVEWAEVGADSEAPALLGTASVVIEDALEPEPAPAAALPPPPIPRGCPSLDRPPDGAVVLPPSSLSTLGDKFRRVITGGSDILLLSKLEAEAAVDARTGDDTLFVYRPADNALVSGGPGRDVLVLCSMAGRRAVLVGNETIASFDDDPDTIVIEAAVFDGATPATPRNISIPSFFVGIDTLVLRVPAAMEPMVSVRSQPLGMEIAVGDTRIILGQLAVVFDDRPRPPLEGSGSLIIEPVS